MTRPRRLRASSVVLGLLLSHAFVFVGPDDDCMQYGFHLSGGGPDGPTFSVAANEHTP